MPRCQRVTSVGVGLPGSITVDGVLTSSPHLPGVVQFDAASRSEERLGRTVKVTNDASCAALAESRVGAGRGVDDLIMITLGTGIGGGVIAGGRLLLGAHGYLGEFGHMMIDPDGPVCPCGKRGCWERYASGSAIALEAKRLAIYEGRLDAVAAAPDRWSTSPPSTSSPRRSTATPTRSTCSATSPAGWPSAWAA